MGIANIRLRFLIEIIGNYDNISASQPCTIGFDLGVWKQELRLLQRLEVHASALMPNRACLDFKGDVHAFIGQVLHSVCDLADRRKAHVLGKGAGVSHTNWRACIPLDSCGPFVWRNAIGDIGEGHAIAILKRFGHGFGYGQACARALQQVLHVIRECL